MQSKANTVQEYLEQIEDSKKEIFIKIRDCILKQLPSGFYEHIGYGMVCFSVPHSAYPNGYHCDPKQPLPFISQRLKKTL